MECKLVYKTNSFLTQVRVQSAYSVVHSDLLQVDPLLHIVIATGRFQELLKLLLAYYMNINK